jgi:hypothetical protein
MTQQDNLQDLALNIFRKFGWENDKFVTVESLFSPSGRIVFVAVSCGTGIWVFKDGHADCESSPEEVLVVHQRAGTYCGLKARMTVVQTSTIRDEIKVAGFFHNRRRFSSHRFFS